MAASLGSGAPTLAAPTDVITAPDRFPFDYFGTAIAVSGDHLVTSYPARFPSLKGRLFSFLISGAEPVEQSSFATNAYGDGLGSAVAADGDLVVVGRPWSRQNQWSGNPQAGSVVLLRREPDGGLTHEATIAETSFAYELGASVDIDDGWVVAGMPGALVGSSRLGRVRFFWTDGDALTQVIDIDAPFEPMPRGFGRSASISGEWAAASAIRYRGDLPLSGIVWLMHRDANGQWLVDTMLAPPEAYDGDQFGAALELNGDLLAAGAPAPGQVGDASRGAAFLYRNVDGAWSLEASFEAPDEEFCEGFGRSIALDADRLAIGALDTGAGDTDFAAVYLYRRVVAGSKSIWLPAGKRLGLASEDFGAALAFAGDRLAVGVPGAMVDGIESAGFVELLSLLDGDANRDGVVDGADLTAALGAWGSAAPGEPADFNADGFVDGADITIVLGNWS